MSEAQKGDAQDQGQLIGQFGVGFYSGFIVADKITVESRRAGLPANEGVRWVSGGSGDFEVEAIDKADRGTSITLHLREDALQFANNWQLKSIINKYADHISLPIQIEQEEWQEAAEEGQPGKADDRQPLAKDRQLAQPASRCLAGDAAGQQAGSGQAAQLARLECETTETQNKIKELNGYVSQ